VTARKQTMLLVSDRSHSLPDHVLWARRPGGKGEINREKSGPRGYGRFL